MWFHQDCACRRRCGQGWQPHIPDAILASNSLETYRAFVGGLFEADGTVTGGYPSWSTTSIEFSHDIQSLLLAIGYPTTRKMDRTACGGSPPAVLRILNLSYSPGFAEEIGFISDRKQAALVSTTTAQAARHDHIPAPRSLIDRLAPENGRLRRTMLASLARNGMVSRRSARELLKRTNDGELARLLGHFYDRVCRADLGEEQWTYDLSVPDNVTYVANGFVSHNTIGLVMDCGHHRRGARFRPGEVQEAGRRRLLQDRQPVDSPGAAPSRVPGGPGRRYHHLRRWGLIAGGSAVHQPGKR